MYQGRENPPRDYRLVHGGPPRPRGPPRRRDDYYAPQDNTLRYNDTSVYEPRPRFGPPRHSTYPRMYDNRPPPRFSHDLGPRPRPRRGGNFSLNNERPHYLSNDAYRENFPSSAKRRRNDEDNFYRGARPRPRRDGWISDRGAQDNFRRDTDRSDQQFAYRPNHRYGPPEFERPVSRPAAYQRPPRDGGRGHQSQIRRAPLRRKKETQQPESSPERNINTKPNVESTQQNEQTTSIDANKAQVQIDPLFVDRIEILIRQIEVDALMHWYSDDSRLCVATQVAEAAQHRIDTAKPAFEALIQPFLLQFQQHRNETLSTAGDGEPAVALALDEN